MRLGGSTLIVTPPVGSRHLAGGLRVKPTAASDPLSRDIVLTEGVLVRGHTTDERTNEPVRGRVDYYAYETNPALQQTDSLFPAASRDRHGIEIGVDGRFEIPVLPGKGILGFNAGEEFQRGLGIEAIDCPKISGKNYLQFVTSPTRCQASSLNLVLAIDPQPNENEFTVSATLRSVPDIPGRVLSPAGQPLADFFIEGIRNVWPKNEGETFTIKGYTPAEKRWLLVYHRPLDLAGYYVLEGQPPEKVEINLRPAATFLGRILDEEGLPLEIPQIDADVTAPGTAGQSAGIRALPLDEDAAGHSRIPHSDANGRFTLRGIVPGLKYTATVHLPTRRPIGKFTIFVDATAEPGEIKDLGDLRPSPVKPDAAKVPEKSKDDGADDGKPKSGSKSTDGAAAHGAAKAPAGVAPNSVLGTQAAARTTSETKQDADVT